MRQVLLMTTLHGIIFKSLDLFWLNLRRFFYNHKTLFDTIFLLVYSAEQLILFLLVLTMPKYAYLFAGVFALLFITTISFERLCMESRYALLKEKMMIQEIQMHWLIKKHDGLVEENRYLRDILIKK